MPLPRTGELSKQLVTEAKSTAERARPGGVSALVLQQFLRDLDAAYKNFFYGLKGSVPGHVPAQRSRNPPETLTHPVGAGGNPRP